jgi:hypothetical protein
MVYRRRNALHRNYYVYVFYTFEDVTNYCQTEFSGPWQSVLGCRLINASSLAKGDDYDVSLYSE